MRVFVFFSSLLEILLVCELSRYHHHERGATISSDPEQPPPRREEMTRRHDVISKMNCDMHFSLFPLVSSAFPVSHRSDTFHHISLLLCQQRSMVDCCTCSVTGFEKSMGKKMKERHERMNDANSIGKLQGMKQK